MSYSAPSELLHVATHLERPLETENIALLSDILWPVGPYWWDHCSAEHVEVA